MSTALAKWGNALGVRIPAYLVKQANLHSGDTVDLLLLGSGEILIKPATSKVKLEDLLSQITKSNRYSECDWGDEKGNEAW